MRHPAWDGGASPDFSTGGPIRRAGGLGRFEVQFEGFPEILDRFFLRGALAGNVDFQALRHVPVTLTPDSCGNRSLHGSIVSLESWGFGRSERGSAPSGWMTILDLFRKQVDDAGGGSYQNLINQVLRAYIEWSQEPLEVILRCVVREELRRAS